MLQEERIRKTTNWRNERLGGSQNFVWLLVIAPAQPPEPNILLVSINRAERFGIPLRVSEDDKKRARAERFGLPEKSSENGALERPKKKMKQTPGKKQPQQQQQQQQNKKPAAPKKRYTLEEMMT